MTNRAATAAKPSAEPTPEPDQPELDQPAPAGDPPRPAQPLNYRCEFMLETPEGFHVLMVGEQLTPKDALAWMKSASAELARQGFKPVRRDVNVELHAAAAPAGGTATTAPPAGAAEATWIKGENGAPPRCSLHGIGKYIEGTYKPDHAKAGQHFAFWGCQTRGCRPKGDPV